MHPPTSFTTERLLLRQPDLADAEAIFHGYAQDPEVTRYLVWRPHASLAETRAFLERCRLSWQQESEFTYAICDRASADLLGMFSLRVASFSAAIGYVLKRSAWGLAIMPEAATAVVQWALAQPELFRVWAICDEQNQASARVMEKIGMQREGLMRRGVLHPNISAEPRNCWLYAIVR